MKKIQRYKPPFKQLLLIFLFAVALYANTFNHNYTLDDQVVIDENKITQMGFKGIPIIFSSAYRYGYMSNKPDVGLYRPLSVATFAIECQFFGANPMVSHINNILLYGITGIVLYLSLLRIFHSINFTLSLLTVLFFIAHPVHTEVVANIKSRDEILAFLLSISSFFFLMKYCQDGFKSGQILLSIFCLFLAILSKENTVTFLLIFPLLIFYFTNLEVKRKLFQSLLFVIPFLAALGLRLLFIKAMEGGLDMPIVQNSLLAATNSSDRLATTVGMMGKYISLLVFPHPLIYDYSYNQIPIISWSNPNVILSVITVSALLLYAFIRIKKKEITVFSILYFFISISLVSNFFLIIAWTFGERFLYIPSLGYCIILALILLKILKIELTHHFVPQKKRIILISLVSIILVGYGFKTIDRNKAWESNYTLFTTDIQYGAQSARLQGHLGSELIKQSKTLKSQTKKLEYSRKAIEHFSKAVEIYPRYHDIYNEIGSVYLEMGEYNPAILNYNKALAIDSFYVDALHNIAIVYSRQNNHQSAKKLYQRVIKINPEYAQSYINLANIYFTENNIDSAIALTIKGNQLDPENENISQNFGIFFNKKGQLLVAQAKQTQDTVEKKKFIMLAIEYLNRTLSIFPNSKTIYNEIGNAYFEIGSFQSALSNYQAALSIDSKYTDACYNIAITYDALGDTKMALQLYEKTLTLDPGYVNAYINMANTLFNAGETENALNTAFKSVSLFPEETMIYYNISVMYNKLGDNKNYLKYKAIGDSVFSKLQQNNIKNDS